MTNLSRRGVLRAAGGVAAGLAVGGLAAGSASARPGMVLTYEATYRRGVPFTVGPVIVPDAPYPRCGSRSTPTDPLDGILIEYDGGNAGLPFPPAIAVDAALTIEAGSRYEFTAAEPVECDYDGLTPGGIVVVRTAMRPVE